VSASRYPREPDFAQFLSVLRNERPQRPMLFERLVGTPMPSDPGAFLRSPGSRDETLAQYRKLGRWSPRGPSSNDSRGPILPLLTLQFWMR